MRLLNRIRVVGQVARHLGVPWLVFRVFHTAKKRTGYLAWRQPVTQWEARPLPNLISNPKVAEPERYLDFRRQAATFFFSSGDQLEFQRYFGAWDQPRPRPVMEAERIAAGEQLYFRHRWAKT